MTEPDPIAALAAQLEVLRGQLARYTGETGHLRARLDEDSGQVVMLRLEIKKLGEKIDAAIARRQADEPQAPYWLGPDQGGARGPARRAAGLGRAGRPRPVPGLLRQAPAVLAIALRGGDRALHRDDGVGPHLRRPGKQAPAGRPRVERQVAARCPRPADRRDQVRRLRLPPGDAARPGSDRLRAIPDLPRRPRRASPAPGPSA